jgi:hypothetical protein
MKRKFKTDLSVNGINNLKKEMINYRDNILQQKLLLLTKILAEKGVIIAQANVARLDAIFTGELMGSIHPLNGGSGNNTAIFFIVADSEHAAFVEFGTGQMGMEAPYPYPLPPGADWEYNTGKTIFEISPGQYGWFYPGNDGRWYFTQGMPARPFMMETALELMMLVEKTAKEVFAT